MTAANMGAHIRSLWLLAMREAITAQLAGNGGSAAAALTHAAKVRCQVQTGLQEQRQEQERAPQKKSLWQKIQIFWS